MLSGLGNHFISESIPNALPKDQNSPLKAPLNLYAEQISGSSFTCPRSSNKKTWVYRIRPSVIHSPFKKIHSIGLLKCFDNENTDCSPNQLRWSPFEFPKVPLTWSRSLFTVCGQGSPQLKNGLAIHVYLAGISMIDEAFYNADGDFLIVPQCGVLDIQTELGNLTVEPMEICVIPRGIRFSISLPSGYVLEVYSGHFELPELGPIGSNGLANPRHFLHPTAHHENVEKPFSIVSKYFNELYEAKQNHSPFDVVSWAGNYCPFKYDLRLFNTINTVSFDHPDPSIFTVLTVKSNEVGTAIADFVIFPPRWSIKLIGFILGWSEVAEHTFRPPYFHRNTMSEFMGLIDGTYDAKSGGFLPGGSLHNVMSPHGPDYSTYEKAINETDQLPVKFQGGMAFMFESCFGLSTSKWAMGTLYNDSESIGGKALQKDYYQVK